MVIKCHETAFDIIVPYTCFAKKLFDVFFIEHANNL